MEVGYKKTVEQPLLTEDMQAYLDQFRSHLDQFKVRLGSFAKNLEHLYNRRQDKRAC